MGPSEQVLGQKMDMFSGAHAKQNLSNNAQSSVRVLCAAANFNFCDSHILCTFCVYFLCTVYFLCKSTYCVTGVLGMYEVYLISCV